MELWFIFALLTALIGGVITFGLKVAAAHNYDASLVVAFMYFQLGLISGVIWFLLGTNTTNYKTLVVAGAIAGFSISLSNIFKVTSLKYIDAAIFFPVYKILGPLLIAATGVVLFKETFSVFEIIGILTGVLVPLLLIHRSENSRQSNLVLGMVFLLAATSVSMFSIVSQKIAAGTQSNIFLFMMISGVTGFIVAAISYIHKNGTKNLVFSEKGVQKTIFLGLALGFLEVCIAYCFLRALEVGLLGIVYTINSFYILIPIVLSVWLYKEHMNVRKGIAIALSILAIIFFGL